MGLLEWSFGTGIDQRTRPEYVDGAAAWLSLENVRVPKMGGADKRYGFSTGSLTRGDLTSRAAAHRVFADGQVTCTIDGTYVDGYSATGSVSYVRGRVPEADFRLIDLPTMGKDGTVEDIAYCGGYLAFTSIVTVASTTYSVVTVVDATTGAFVHGPYILGAYTPTLIATYGTYFMVVRGDTAMTTLSSFYFDTTSTSTINTGWVSAGTVTNAWSGTTPAFALASLSTRIAIIYNVSSGTDRVVVKTWNISGVVETATVGTGSVTPSGVDIAIGPNADTLWLAWNQTTAVKVAGLTPTNLAVVLATSATMITATASVNYPKICAHGTTSSKARVLTFDFSTWVRTRIQGVQISAGAAATDGTGTLLPGVGTMGRPFAKGTRYYVLAQAGLPSFGSTTQGVACVVDWTGDVTWVRPVANVEPGLAVASIWGNSGSGGGTVIQASSSDKRYLTLNVRRSSIGNASQLVELDFASRNRWQVVAHGNSAYLSGGVVGYMDGRGFSEAGFIHRPPKPITATSGTGLTFTTGVRYVAVYECVDSDGNLTISGVSDPSDSTGAVANKTITVTSQPCAMTYRLDSTGLAAASSRIAFYRTKDGGVPPYYRLTTIDNDTSAATVSYADTTADATLAANAKLYEQPGVNGSAQDRRAPPGLNHLTSYNGMLVGANGRNVWHSGQPVVGEAAWFNPIFQVPIDGEGDVTGLASMDGTLFVFKRRGIWAISGEPPSDNASSGGLGTPRRLAVDVGCIEQRSIVVTALGVFFQSDRGIELLSRGQAVEWIGESVQDEITARPYVMAATLDPAEAVVYFELSSGVSSGQASGTGRGLVYDLTLKKWVSTDRRVDSLGHADAPAQSACIVWNGSAYRYAWCDIYGYVYTEDQTTYLDPGSTWVTKRAESAWAKSAGLQGRQHFQTVKLLAKYATDLNLRIYVAYDYNTSYQAARTWTRSELAALTTGMGGAGTMPNIQVEHLANDDGGDCMAVRVKVEDVTPTGGSVGTGQGAVWNTVSFEGAPLTGGYQLPDGAR